MGAARRQPTEGRQGRHALTGAHWRARGRDKGCGEITDCRCLQRPPLVRPCTQALAIVVNSYFMFVNLCTVFHVSAMSVNLCIVR